MTVESVRWQTNEINELAIMAARWNRYVEEWDDTMFLKDKYIEIYASVLHTMELMSKLVTTELKCLQDGVDLKCANEP